MRYKSKYSKKTVTAAQYVTEVICEHKALRDKKDLYYRFWINKEWANFFRNQIATANKLIEQYGEKAVIRALNDSRSKRIFSLRAPSLLKTIKEKVIEVEKENQTLTKKFDRNKSTEFRKRQNKKSIFDKLEDIDNDQD
tara:strand:- start:53 stop:469 length:417 start_codon:yes stop_codon:yes gene_type:complete